MLLKGCKLRTTDKQKTIYIKPFTEMYVKKREEVSDVARCSTLDIGCLIHFSKQTNKQDFKFRMNNSLS
jgi:hypothetical protein